jgi:hypothetical protein
MKAEANFRTAGDFPHAERYGARQHFGNDESLQPGASRLSG